MRQGVETAPQPPRPTAGRAEQLAFWNPCTPNYTGLPHDGRLRSFPEKATRTKLCTPPPVLGGLRALPVPAGLTPCGVSPGQAPLAAVPGTSSGRRQRPTLRLFTCSAAPRGETEAQVAKKLAEGLQLDSGARVTLWPPQLAPVESLVGLRAVPVPLEEALRPSADRSGGPCCPAGGSLGGPGLGCGRGPPPQGSSSCGGSRTERALRGTFRGPPSCPHLSCRGSQPLPQGRSWYERLGRYLSRLEPGLHGPPEQERDTEAGGVRPRGLGLGLGLGRGQGPLRGEGAVRGAEDARPSMGGLLSPAPTKLRQPRLSGGGSESESG